MSRGGARPGAGQPPVAGQPQTERFNLWATEAEKAEIQDAVPDRNPDGGRYSVNRWIVEAALMRARSISPDDLRSVVETIVRARVACVADWDGFAPGSVERMIEGIAVQVANAIAPLVRDHAGPDVTRDLGAKETKR